MRATQIAIAAVTSAALATLALSVPSEAESGWSSVPVPTGEVAVEAISTVSPSDAWAVGFGNGSTVFRYDGLSWRRVAAPSVSGVRIATDDVFADAPGEAWVLGQRSSSTGAGDVTAHWGGSAWALHPIARPGKTFLFAIAAAPGTGTAWAVGEDYLTESIPMVEFYDGSAWHRTRAPGTGSLQRVAVHGRNEVWAVGYGFGLQSALIDHWNGTRWRRVAGVAAAQTTDDVAAVPGSNHVWVVGSSKRSQPFAEFFGGARWIRTPIAKVDGSGTLTRVVAINGHDAWAIGSAYDADDNPSAELLEHWDGTAWTQMPFPEAAPPNHQILTLAGVRSTGELWAAGLQGPSPTSFGMLILHHS